ncbi:hypothetical protein [Lacticaseibacillus paracasei]|uniref:hypothetical protein n=1 Tax=Lacticaseibacillus paracasei TaxID=1597 RepID=UPI00189294C1|nr:hypothetical protein [Lacticaseibacillus paracasei]QPC23076.1 hypothetical protein LacP0625_06230 [Lacticaseibacillus paracasei subsp. tolerans]
MNPEDLKAREDIKKRLLDLSAEANGIKDYQLGALILTAYNRCDDNVTIQDGNLYVNGKLMIIDNATLAKHMGLSFTGDNKAPSGNASYISTIELKDDGPYLNGKRIKGLIDMNIESRAGDFTKVDLKLVAKVHGLDDIKQEYSF